MVVTNHYICYTKAWKFLSRKGEDAPSEVLLSSVEFLLFDKSPSPPLIHVMNRREGKTTMCARLALYMAESGMRVTYVPAHHSSIQIFRDYIRRTYPDVKRLGPSSIELGKGQIFIVTTQCLRGCHGPFIFDDIEYNKKRWAQHCEMRPDVKNIGFMSPRREYSDDNY